MARRVFFSFHYQRDIFRANVVRNSWRFRPEYEISNAFWDGSLWEKTKTEGDAAVKRLIAQGLNNTSATVVLIGAETSKRQWIQHEIDESLTRGNGLVGVYLHNIKDQLGFVDTPGNNPFDNLRFASTKQLLSTAYRTYDWINDDGYRNLAGWVEAAAKAAGR